jgi:hypothetical protein
MSKDQNLDDRNSDCPVPGSGAAGFRIFEHLCFEFVSSFEFRHSDLWPVNEFWSNRMLMINEK